MDLTTLATTIFEIVTPVITNKKVQEFSKKIWEKVTPWFTKDEKENDILKKLKKDPENELYQKRLFIELEMILDENPEFRKELETLINDAEKNGDEQTRTLIHNSKNIVTGNIQNITGSIHIGDNINTDNN